MNVKVHLSSQSKSIDHKDVINAYTKDGMFCVYIQENIVYKYPMVNIFRVEETYTCDTSERMELKLNDKTLIGRYDCNGKLIILLHDKLDISFFKEWVNIRRNTRHKIDYVRDVVFANVTEHGTLVNCFPILSKNEHFVELYYDVKAVNGKNY